MKKRITALLFAALISAMSVMPAFAAEEIYSGTDSYDLSKVEADGNKDNSGLATFGPIASIDNPFYGEDTSDGITIKFNVSDVDTVAKLGTILAFVDDTEAQRMWITPALYFGYNDGTKYVDANITSGYGMVADYIDGRDCEITFILTTDGFEMYVDDIKCYDQSVLEGDDTGVSGLVGGAQQTFSSYNFILNMLAKKATQLQVGSGSFWHAVGYDEAQMTVSDIRCYLGVLKPGSSTDSTAITDADGSTVAVQQVTTVAASESTGLNPMVIAIFVVVIVIIIAVAVVAVVLKNNKNNNN
jgi:hypothetical protein